MKSSETTGADLAEVVARARTEIEELSQAASELRATVPERVSQGIREAIEAEVLPVARHIAEVRGLSSQIVRRLERTQSAVEAEREARVDDLDVLVDLLVSSWQGIDARLYRIEAKLDSDLPLSAVNERPPHTSALGSR